MLKRLKKTSLILVSITVVLVISLCFNKGKNSFKQKDTVALSKYAEITSDNENVIYLSDIDYVQNLYGENSNANSSYVESGKYLRKDKNANSGLITLNIYDAENDTTTPTSFIKGLSAWATSNLIYDVRELKEKGFVEFSTYLGVDASQTDTYANNGVRFIIYTKTEDGNWQEVKSTNILKGWDKAEYVSIDIREVDYIRLYANENGNDWFTSWYDDAVYADAKFTKVGYVKDNTPSPIVKTLSEYDEEIKNLVSLDNLKDNSSYEKVLLQRKFVNNIGYDILQALMHYSSSYKQIIEWLMDDEELLRLYLLGGTPDGNYVTSLKLLNQLYFTYQEDLSDTEHKDLYTKMMITLSLTHSQSVGSWVTGAPEDISDPNGSDALLRYKIFKELYNDGLLKNEIFENISVEEMRFVMNNIISDEEIKWLNYYATKVGSTNPYTYINYRSEYKYDLDKYYTEDNRNTWVNKYELNKFADEGLDVTYGVPKLWIVFEEGSVCGGLSKTGSNIWGSYGVPSTVVSQPGHAAYIYMSIDDKGNKIWNLYNDVYGWGKSGKTEKLSTRMPLGWGTGSYVGDYPVTYILLAQAALDDKDNTRSNNNLTKYEQAEEIIMLADVYKDDYKTLETIYRKALETQNINFDAWLGLVNVYLNRGTTTQDEYLSLIREIINTLKYYPLPMHDLVRLIEPKLETKNHVTYQALLSNALETATKATEANVLQPGPCKQAAEYLLGSNDTTVATFSFDGEDAGVIKLADRYTQSAGEVVWQYTLKGVLVESDLDGDGICDTNCDSTEGHWSKNIHTSSYQLSEEEIASINTENDILIRIVGAMDTIYDIPITKANLPANLYANDLENRIFGINTNMEWFNEDENRWIYFKDADPILRGNENIKVRVAANGTQLASDEKEFTFTDEGETLENYYIPVSRLSIAGYSTDAAGNGDAVTNLLDGNINTIWHTNWTSGSDTQRYVILKLERPSYLTSLEYVPRQSASNGNILTTRISVTNDKDILNEDGSVKANVDWKNVFENSDTPWSNNNRSKTATFNINHDGEEEYAVTYIKIEGLDTIGGFMSAAMFNLFEDMSKYKLPAVEIDYSTITATNKPVKASLTLAKANAGNNDITEDTEISDVIKITNIETDEEGNKVCIQDIVDYPDSEEENCLSDFSHIFTKNGEYTFNYSDLEEKNFGSITVKVDWIDTTTPTAKLEYSTKDKTNQDVTVKLVNANKSITITSNNGSDTYTFDKNGTFVFTYIDRYGNTGETVATVDWIDKEAPIGFITFEETEEGVIATLHTDEDVLISGDGSNTHLFTSNGSYEFVYVDEAGNVSRTIATVDWIKDKEEDVNPSDKPTTDNDDKPNEDNKPNNDDKTNEKEADNSSGNQEENIKPEVKPEETKPEVPNTYDNIIDYIGLSIISLLTFVILSIYALKKE